MHKILTIIAVSLLLSCSSSSVYHTHGLSQPDWLLNPYNKYSEQRYLAVVGNGTSREQAERNAAGRLSQIFEVRVTIDELHHRRYTEIMSSDDQYHEDHYNLDQIIRLQSGQTLHNIMYADTYQDNDGTVYVLAYMNRAQTAEIYYNKIQENTDRILHLVNQSSESDDNIIQYAAMNAALTIAQVNRLLLQQLDIIQPGRASTLNLGYRPEDIQQMAREYAREISFSIHFENDHNGLIGIQVEGMLTNLGFQVSDEGLLRINGDVIFDETDLRRVDGIVFVRYDLYLNIIDRKDNVLVSLNERGREGHYTFEEALQRSVRQLEKKVNQTLRTNLLRYFDSLVINNITNK